MEEDRWSGARLETRIFQVSEAGEITDLEGLTQGMGLDIRPFVGSRWLRTGATEHNTVTGKPGLDLFYNFTPSLKLSATVNTDFGETEVDARQINLTRFPCSFRRSGRFSWRMSGSSALPVPLLLDVEAFPGPESTYDRFSAGRSDCFPGRRCRSILD